VRAHLLFLVVYSRDCGDDETYYHHHLYCSSGERERVLTAKGDDV